MTLNSNAASLDHQQPSLTPIVPSSQASPIRCALWEFVNGPFETSNVAEKYIPISSPATSSKYATKSGQAGKRIWSSIRIQSFTRTAVGRVVDHSPLVGLGVFFSTAPNEATTRCSPHSSRAFLTGTVMRPSFTSSSDCLRMDMRALCCGDVIVSTALPVAAVFPFLKQSLR